MSNKSAYLAQRAKLEAQIALAGIECGQQKMADYFQCVLHDPKVMGHNVMGKKRIARILAAVEARDKYYAPAYTDRVDADCLQEQLDGELRDIWGDKLVPFRERQPRVKQYGYEKARKGWK